MTAGLELLTERRRITSHREDTAGRPRTIDRHSNPKGTA